VRAIANAYNAFFECFQRTFSTRKDTLNRLRLRSVLIRF
jgi:hypothetical protein